MQCNYLAPDAEVVEIEQLTTLCQSTGESNLRFGNRGAAGNQIESDDIVDGGTI